MKAAPASAAFDPSEIRTLVVGDNAFERRLVQDLLIALGVKEIILAEDLIAAFAQIRLRHPRMIIVDAEMRPTNGLAFVRELRRSGIAAAETPLVLFTSETSADFADIARNSGVHEVIAKPVSASSMRRCLEEALMRKPDFSALSRRAPPRRGDPRLAMSASTASVRPDNAFRAAAQAGLDRARAELAHWAGDGDAAHIGMARAAIEEIENAAEATGDFVFCRALAAIRRLLEAAERDQADMRVLDLSLTAAKALLSSEKGRMAMREALAEAVAEAAESRGK